MANNEYTMNRKLAGSDIQKEDFDSVPLSAQELEAIQSYANLILNSLITISNPHAGFDAASVKRLSDDLNRSRTTLDADACIKIANMYGAFLGSALIAANRKADGKWVRLKNGDVAIRFDKSKDGMKNFALPITRVFKHIEHGEVHSIYSFFLAICDLVTGGKPEGNVSMAMSEPASAPAPQTPGQNRVMIGEYAYGGGLFLTLPQGQCCNCGTSRNLKPVASRMARTDKEENRIIHFALDLPYCSSCAYTARKLPFGIGLKAFITFIAYIVFIALVLLPLSAKGIVVTHGGLLLSLFTLFVIGIYFWQYKAKAPRTSNYQPVRLTDMDMVSGSISHIRLKFSSPSYLKEFTRLNRDLISKGTVKVH